MVGAFISWSAVALAVLSVSGAAQSAKISSCPGYSASNIRTSSNGLTASLKLAGQACNAYGTDLSELVLQVEYETGT